LNIAEIFCTNDIEGTGFGSQYIAGTAIFFGENADDEGPDSLGIPGTNQAFGSADYKALGAGAEVKGSNGGFSPVFPLIHIDGDRLRNHFRVGGCLEIQVIG
jgi:hypothetical protein